MNPFRIAGLIFALAAVAAGLYFGVSYRHLAAKAATADARIAQAEATAAGLQRQIDTISRETIRRDEFDRALREARTAVSRNLDTASREDPAAAGYLSEPIPQRVRDAFRQASEAQR